MYVRIYYIGIFGTIIIPNPENYWVFTEKTFYIFLSLAFYLYYLNDLYFLLGVRKPAQAVISFMIRILAIPIADFIAMTAFVAQESKFISNINTNSLAMLHNLYLSAEVV